MQDITAAFISKAIAPLSWLQIYNRVAKSLCAAPKATLPQLSSLLHSLAAKTTIAPQLNGYGLCPLALVNPNCRPTCGGHDCRAALFFWVFLSIVVIEAIILVPSVRRRERELLNYLRSLSAAQAEGLLSAQVV
ncbi:MAG: hypothetical protein AAF609_15705 [Cyanobacteria bacterium P01_C01_bin.120]